MVKKREKKTINYIKNKLEPKSRCSTINYFFLSNHTKEFLMTNICEQQLLSLVQTNPMEKKYKEKLPVHYWN